jgi:CHAD domain-containing protein
VAKARPIQLSAGERYADAAARTIATRSEELIAHSKDVLDISDVERLHDMRVASRRLRAALEVFEECFPGKEFRRALRDVKSLADALGERRDRDVTIKAVRSFGGEMPSADQPGINALVDRLREEQEAANRELEPLVAGGALADLNRRLQGLAAAAR